jgi:hypothetical protein
MDEAERYVYEAFATDYGVCARCQANEPLGFLVGDDEADVAAARRVLRTRG